jgi:iron complex outermembrane recepter protein
LKLLSSDKKAEFTVSAFDIERKNVYVPESGILFNVAGKIASKDFEAAAAVNPFGGLRLWGNAAFVRSRFVNFDFIDGNGLPQSYSGMPPPNVPSFVANAGHPIASKPPCRWNWAHRSAMLVTASISRTTSSP